MRKLVLMMTCCLVICGVAYRFGETKWEDAKVIAVEKLYTGISEMMFPQLHTYQMDTESFFCKDVEQILMPVVYEFRSNVTSASMEQGAQEIGQGDGVTEQTQGEEAIVQQDGDNATVQQQGNEATAQQQENSATAQPPTEESTSENAQETVAQTAPPSENMLQKKVEVNRIKLQDFDYLRQNFYQVDNTTTINRQQMEISKLLGKDMTLSEYGDGPKILIYHTHSQEGYADSKPGDASTTVMALGDELSRILTEKYGIPVLHHTGVYDVPDHAHAYANALPDLEQILRENPDIEVIIDLHRDGVPATTHLVTEINGKPTAQIMFFNGLSRTTSQGELTHLKNPNIEDNLAFSFQMQLAAAEYYPGFTRKIYLKGYRYNMHLLPKSMLVEVGAQTNTFEEAKNAMEPLADLLALVLTENSSD